jgi:hypothetical protein
VDAYDGDVEDPRDNWSRCLTAAATRDGVGCSYQEVATVGTDDELDVVLATQELEDGGQTTIDELVENQPRNTG